MSAGLAPGQVAQALARPPDGLGETEIARVLFAALEDEVAGEHVLVLVPDRTRDVPLAALFPVVTQALHRASAIDVMVALGTHPPLARGGILDLIGTGAGAGKRVGMVHNHEWSSTSALRPIGTVSAGRLREIAGPTWHHSLGGDFVVRVNKLALEVDRIVIVGPTLPHEVAGFSGGAKYLFPGISGPEMIDVMHWLGALSGVLATIGLRGTPVRALINEAAALLPTPVSMVALVTDPSGQGARLSGDVARLSGDVARPSGDVARIAGIYAGSLEEAWSASVAQAELLHTHWLEHPYSRVVSVPMPIYQELWTAGKAMYKLEPVVADGGELVIYAPHLSEVSVSHGEGIFRVGYHCLEYFLAQWERFTHEPLAVLAHSTHVKGAGAFDQATGTERPRIEVKLATGISPQDCERLNLGYIDPSSIDLAEATADQGTLVVPRSGEILFRATPS